MALKWAVTDRFHKYLYGGTFDVFTDNNPLTYILTTAKLDAMGHRWVASLGPYNFNLHYKPGKLNSNADALSRIDWKSVMVEEVKATMDLAQVDRTVIVDPWVFQDTLEDVPVMKSLKTEDATKKWRQRQNQDPEIRAIIQMIKDETWDHYKYSKKDPQSMKSYVKVRSELTLHQGLLFHKLRLKDKDEDTYQFVVPLEFRKLALSLKHDSFGHLGIDRSTVLMIDRFFWPKMSPISYHPMGNGQPERFNRTLLTMIGCLPAVEKAKWQSWVNHLTHAYNCTKSQVTGFSPYFLMFGREPRIPVDEAFRGYIPIQTRKKHGGLCPPFKGKVTVGL